MAADGIDERMGAAMAARRKDLGLSQTVLAERLTDLGMVVDASAVSRIENAQRSVRLSEAEIIAEALETTVVALVGSTHDRSPRERLGVLRSEVLPGAFEAMDALFGLAESVSRVQQMLVKNPGLLTSLSVEWLPAPESVEDYPAWEAAYLRRLLTVDMRIERRIDLPTRAMRPVLDVLVDIAVGEV